MLPHVKPLELVNEIWYDLGLREGIFAVAHFYSIDEHPERCPIPACSRSPLAETAERVQNHLPVCSYFRHAYWKGEFTNKLSAVGTSTRDEGTWYAAERCAYHDLLLQVCDWPGCTNQT
jgi:hypothetical protein